MRIGRNDHLSSQALVLNSWIFLSNKTSVITVYSSMRQVSTLRWEQQTEDAEAPKWSREAICQEPRLRPEGLGDPEQVT